MFTLAVLAATVVVATVDSADAARRKRGGGYAPPYASIVVDVNSGKTLQGVNPDAPRFPASVTKVMTLYMLFEQLERGRLQLDTPLRVSAFAARQAPSKIGFDPGETIEVEEAIKALVTKSANDVAVVVAEAIGGDQDTFAEMMTRKARSIGMSRTTFRNASGLPDREQVTTARDLARLGQVIHDRFPKYWRYFQTRNFEFAGRNYRNHNKLLGRVDGVDGIKTGYTRASGFNLLTSARVGNRHLIAVVLGGRSGRIRDAQMASLVENHLPRAYAGLRTNPVFAEVRSDEPSRVAVVQPEVSRRETSVEVAKVEPKSEQRVVVARVETKTIEPAKPAPVALTQADIKRIAAANAKSDARPVQQVAGRAATPVAAFAAAPVQTGPQLRWTTGPQPVAAAKGIQPRNGKQAAVTVAKADPVTTASVPNTSGNRSGYVIQLGASDNEGKARAILDQAKTRNKLVLAEADAFTEKVQKGDATLFRARFGGFDDNKEANAACGALKKTGFNCFVQRI